MKNLLQSVMTIVWCVCSFSVMAQMSYGGEPKSFDCVLNPIRWTTIDATDPDSLWAEDSTIQRGEHALRIGVTHNVNFTIYNSGQTEYAPDGTKIWRLGLRCPGATFTSVFFNQFDIPYGAELYFYTPDRQFVIGKFIRRSRLEDNTFYPQEIPGDELVIEYDEPSRNMDQGYFSINRFSQGYRDLFHIYDDEIYDEATDFEEEDESTASFKNNQPGSASGDCHPNAICYNDRWHDQIMASVLYTMTSGGFIYMCSGSLINNTARDGKQYMLSANHCYEGGTWTFYFKNHTATCNGSFAPTIYTATGHSVKARDNYSNSSDFMLVEITGTINPQYNVFLAGWSNSTATPASPGSCACIHHPGGDNAKCSIPVNIKDGAIMFSDTKKFWGVNWATNTGTTEEGSSGSPLFNKDKLIVGQLWAGSSSCSAPHEYDFYGKLSNSWRNNNNSSNAKKLKPWLDPVNSGVHTLQGEYLNNVGITDFSQETNTPDVYPNPSCGDITISGDFADGKGICNVYNMLGTPVYSAQINLSPRFTLHLNHLAGGMYILEINDSHNVYRSKIVIGK